MRSLRAVVGTVASHLHPAISQIRPIMNAEPLDSMFSFCSHCQMVEWGELSFKVVRLEQAGQEVLARAGNFMVARAAFDTSVSLWPAAEIELRQGARVIRSSRQN
jgi:hypothetical protein